MDGIQLCEMPRTSPYNKGGNMADVEKFKSNARGWIRINDALDMFKQGNMSRTKLLELLIDDMLDVEIEGVSETHEAEALSGDVIEVTRYTTKTLHQLITEA